MPFVLAVNYKAPQLLLDLLAFGPFIALPVGIAVLMRARRQQRLLSTAAWLRMRYRVAEIPIGQTRQWLLQLGDGPALCLVSMPFWCFRKTGSPMAKEIDVVGDPQKYVVCRCLATAL